MMEEIKNITVEAINFPSEVKNISIEQVKR